MSSKSKQSVWKREEIKQLIDAVEARKCLWNVKSPLYHNQTKRRAAILEISLELNMPDEDIKKKIHTLRAQYSKERSKMKSSKSGCDADEMYKIKWEFLDMLQFMFCHHDGNITTDSMDSRTSKHDAASSSVEAINESVSYENSAFDTTSTSLQSSIAHDIQDVTQEAPVTRTPCSSSRQNAKRKKLTIPELQEQAAMNRCLSIINQAKPRDEWSTFSDHVANELRLLQTPPDLQLKLKNVIQQSILDISCAYAARQFPSPSLAATQYTTNQSASAYSTPSHAPSPSSASVDFEHQSSQDTSQHFHHDQPLQASQEHSQTSNFSYLINFQHAPSSPSGSDHNQ